LTSQLLSQEWLRSLETAASRYQRELQGESGQAARDYLSARGLPPNVVSDYRLGLVDADSPDHPDYAGWISIPYRTRAGVVSFKFRSLSPTGPKYIGPYETRLFNTLAMDQADRDGTLGIVEGEFDAIVNTALVGIPTVGIPGVDSYKKHPEWRELFRGYQQVLIFEDQDEPKTKVVNGEEVEWRPGRELSKKLKADIDTSRIVRLPSKDVNDCYLEHGADAVLKAAGLL
jgi:DNA primase